MAAGVVPVLDPTNFRPSKALNWKGAPFRPARDQMNDLRLQLEYRWLYFDSHDIYAAAVLKRALGHGPSWFGMAVATSTQHLLSSGVC